MAEDPVGKLSVRDAGVDDLPALTAIKGEASEMLHRDRLRDARHPGFRYLVLLEEDVLIGLACLVFQRPAYWSDGDDPRNLPHAANDEDPIQHLDVRNELGIREGGFGIMLAKGMVDEFKYNDIGNQVTLVKRFPKKD